MLFHITYAASNQSINTVENTIPVGVTPALDQLYYAVIQPASSSFWEGNLKRYRLSGDNVTDVSGNDAIDDETGYFKETARSWWSDEADGPDATQGGARQANGEGFLLALYYN